MKSFILAALTSLLVHTAQAGGLPGYDRLDVRSQHRAYPIAASVWYPMGSATYVSRVGDNPIFKGTPVMLGAGLATGKHPLVLFSHGSGGNMDSMGWLSGALAQRGAMVLAVNHPGSTSGDSSPRRSTQMTTRAQDLSAALDALLADPAFAGYVDPARIYAVGFSLGGATALNLGGCALIESAMQSIATQSRARIVCSCPRGRWILKICRLALRAMPRITGSVGVSQLIPALPMWQMKTVLGPWMCRYS